MKPISELREETSRARYEFLANDAELALTFLDVAANCDNPERARRLYEDAVKAYRLLVTSMPTLPIGPHGMQRLTTLRERLGSRLKVVPVSVPEPLRTSELIP